MPFCKVGEGYGRLWAGKDATFALATLSLKPEDVPQLSPALGHCESSEILAGECA